MDCLQNGEYIGTGSFCKSRFEQHPDFGEVISIYLLPEYMGKGYGRKLLEAVMNELKKQGFTEVFPWVLEENSRASLPARSADLPTAASQRQFYENYGFECANDYLDTAIGGEKLRAVRYMYRFV